ncbi:helix-turn-helix domain-containing protein [Tropicibacter sp. S64]|uniref:helix-turn-helix domain-containing protein n=1 Tax=Tropicibacter sp. S64 TaxID=3415122 RepID=UPI003C7BC61C
MSTPPSTTLGADLRAVRRMRGLTLQEMARQMDRSVGWLSQVERDLSEPSITDLRHMAALLDIPVSSLFGRPDTPLDEAGLIVRQTARRPIGSRQAGLVEELLSPDLTDDFEVVHCTFAPHSRIGEPVSRPTQEVGYLISGRLDLIIAGKPFSLTPGDSFRIRGETFEWINPHDAPAQAIWVIAPPVY